MAGGFRMRSGKPHLVESDITRQVKDFMVAHGWRSIRNQRMVLPGTFQTGEPGMPDMVFIRYLQNGVALVLWVEFKKPGDNRKCTCVKNAGTRRRCTVCDQKAWRDRERQRGGIVWTVA